jgi:hypothetical protein
MCRRLAKILAVVLSSALLLTMVRAAPHLSATPGTCIAGDTVAVESITENGPLNPDPPSQTVKLVFIHHSVGANWLSYWSGDLGDVLGDNNYYVSDTSYGWGPPDEGVGSGTIGDHTDIGHWYNWFVGPHRDTYLSAVYSTNAQNADYSRPMEDPGGENEIVLFKSCYPNSDLKGQPDDPPTAGNNPLRGQAAWTEHHTVGNAKGIYNDLLGYFETRQDKLFVVTTAPPLMDGTYAANARAFNTWLVHDWLDGYPYHNVAVFDFYNVLTTNGGDYDTNDYGQSTGNHHRVAMDSTPAIIEYITDGDDDGNSNVLEYPRDGTDDHPSEAGNQKATGEFVPVLNAYYHCWKHGECGDQAEDWIEVKTAVDSRSTYPGDTATYMLSLSASEGFDQPISLSLQGAPAGATVTFTPNPVIPPGSGRLDITTAAHTPVGIYPLVVTGTSGTLSDSVGLTLTVVSEAPSFGLRVTPKVHTALPGQVIQYEVSVIQVAGPSQAVHLDIIGLPAGTDATWSENPVAQGSSSTLTLALSSGTQLGDYVLWIVGTTPTQVVSESAELRVGTRRIHLPLVFG